MSVGNERDFEPALESGAHRGVDAVFGLHAADDEMIDVHRHQAWLEVGVLEGAAMRLDDRGLAFLGRNRAVDRMAGRAARQRMSGLRGPIVLHIDDIYARLPRTIEQ